MTTNRTILIHETLAALHRLTLHDHTTVAQPERTLNEDEAQAIRDTIDHLTAYLYPFDDDPPANLLREQ